MDEEELSLFERKRRKLHEELCELLGSRNVYYNPPTNMEYPCIRYNLNKPDPTYADNKIYRMTYQFAITIIEYDSTSDLYERIMRHFKYCMFNNSYYADNLHHTVLSLNY